MNFSSQIITYEETHHVFITRLFNKAADKQPAAFHPAEVHAEAPRPAPQSAPVKSNAGAIMAIVKTLDGRWAEVQAKLKAKCDAAIIAQGPAILASLNEELAGISRAEEPIIKPEVKPEVKAAPPMTTNEKRQASQRSLPTASITHVAELIIEGEYTRKEAVKTFSLNTADQHTLDVMLYRLRHPDYVAPRRAAAPAYEPLDLTLLE